MTSNKTSPTTLIIPKTVRDRARTLFDAGRIEDAWRVLADAGDDYAAEAAHITGDQDRFHPHGIGC